MLVEMKMTEDAWFIVRNTPGVTGFVGTGTDPTPVGDHEIAKIKNAWAWPTQASHQLRDW